MKLFMTRKNFFIAIYSLSLFITGSVLGYILSGVINSDSIEKATPTPMPTVPLVKSAQVEDISYETNFEKNKKWILFAKSGSIDDINKIAKLKGINCKFFEKNKKELEVVSDDADVDVNNKNITFNKKVTTTSSEGEKLEVNTLLWTNSAKILSGEGNVKFSKGSDRAWADKMKCDVNFNTYSFENNVILIKKTR